VWKAFSLVQQSLYNTSKNDEWDPFNELTVSKMHLKLNF
jgi:hypothetical protein